MKNNFDVKNIFDLVPLITDEEIRAVTKHGETGPVATREQFLSILMEEVGEVAQDINKDHNDTILKKEIVQVMSVCPRFMQGTLRVSRK